jgi:hypothetical protein
VPYEGGTTVVKLPILYPGSTVVADSSVSSHGVTIIHSEKESNEVILTLKEESRTPEAGADIRLCTMKGGKLTGLGIYVSTCTWLY